MVNIDKISLKFGTLPVLEQLSFEIKKEEIVALIGPSGCGKSTLLNVIAGLIPSDSGEVRKAGDAVSFIFQDDRLLPWCSIWKNISLVENKEDRQKIQKLIDDVGLTGFEHYRPAQLSGGMKKRCGIARAFYHQSTLLLMDEPFQGLDYCLRQEMLKLLLSVWESRKQSILFVTHEIEEALSVADRILVLSGRPAEIVQEITLPPRAERTDTHPELIRARREIMAVITAQGEENDKH